MIMYFNNYNFLGIDGFEFVEYMVVNDEGIEVLKVLFILLGFVEVVVYKFKCVWLYCQGDINFIINVEFVL